MIILGLDTTQGNGAALTPVAHIAAQFPINIWLRDEYFVVEHCINTLVKGKA